MALQATLASDNQIRTSMQSAKGFRGKDPERSADGNPPESDNQGI